MTPKRLSAKFFVTQSPDINLPDFLPVFQRWIQRDAVEGMLIDVVDYAHVHHGPGVILIGDEADYSLDLAEGRPGVLYTRKRAMPPALQDALQTAVRLALTAAQQLEQETTLKNLSFDYSEIQLKFLDRLNAPNTAETFEALKAELQAFADSLYDGAEIVRADGDSREALTITIKSPAPVEAETLAQRLREVIAG